MDKRHSGHTGPTSPAGKAISSQNATSHGIFSSRLIIDGEDPAELAQLEADWLAKYRPYDGITRQFVIDTGHAEWRKRRALRHFDSVSDALAARTALDWSPTEQNAFNLSLRYKTSMERSFLSAYKLLEQHLKAHPPAPPEPPLTPGQRLQKAKEDLISHKSTTIMQFIQIDPKQPFAPDYVNFTNQQIRDALHKYDPPITTILRIYVFYGDEVPKEYAWISPGNMEQRIDLPTWRKLAAREDAAATGLYFDPRPLQQPTHFATGDGDGI
jgi:hypothetical protein